MAGTGKYGLQLRGPAKQAPKPIQKPAFFQDDDEDEDTIERQLAREAARKKKLKEVEEQHKRALEEDPHAFDYDGVYDEMKAKQARPVQKTQEKKEARYIPHLIEKAKMREREHELVYERQLAKERAKEEHLHKDKEKFITAAYKQKLKEREELERLQKLQELREKAEEVTKREDLSDFYRNLTRNVAFGGGGEEPAGTGVQRPESSRNEQQSSSKAEPPSRSSSSPRRSRDRQSSPVLTRPLKEEARSQRSPRASSVEHDQETRTNDDLKTTQQEQPKAQVEVPSAAQVVEAPSAAQVVEAPSAAQVVEAPSTAQPDEQQQKQSEEEARKAKEAAARERFLARKKQRQEA